MRILHTADWHLGKLLHGVSFHDDQDHILDRLCRIAEEKKPDVVVISGDLYDRAVPPAPAVRLLSQTLARLGGLGVPVLVIAGNHDSPDRLEFGSQLLARSGLHIVGNYSATADPVRVTDQHGPVDFYLLPFLHPPAVRIEVDDASLSSHEEATHAALQAWESRWCEESGPGARKVLIAHAFVAGGTESDSERPLMVGGSGTVPAKVFGGFDYVALGHLHEPQKMGRSSIAYSGSILKYSLSEVEHEKSVSLVDLDAEGQVSIERFPLRPLRDLRRIKGTLDELLANPPLPGTADDYIVATLVDRGALLEPMGRLRAIYPNLLAIERPRLDRARPDANLTSRDVRSKDDADLFASFYRQVTGEALDKKQRKAFAEVAQSVLHSSDEK